MYYRVNDKIVEGYNSSFPSSETICGAQIPIWVLVILFLLIIFAIFMAFRYFSRGGSRKTSSRR